MNTRQDEILQKADRDKKLGFSEWMKNPMTKALISTLAPSEHLEALLQACFEQGYNSGVASIMTDIISQMRMPSRREI